MVAAGAQIFSTDFPLPREALIPLSLTTSEHLLQSVLACRAFDISLGLKKENASQKAILQFLK